MTKFSESSLASYGFIRAKNCFELIKNEESLNIILKVQIDNNGQELKIKVIDPVSSEEYRVHLSSKADGEYVQKVRNAISALKRDIIENCCDKTLYADQITMVKDHIKQKYGAEAEYLWKDKFKTDDAIFRKKDNDKWFAVLLSCKKKTLTGTETGSGAEGSGAEEYVDVLNVKIKPADKQSIVDCMYIYPAYHMNKKSWISIVLNYGLDFKIIQKLIDVSFELV